LCDELDAWASELSQNPQLRKETNERRTAAFIYAVTLEGDPSALEEWRWRLMEEIFDDPDDPEKPDQLGA